MDPVVIVGAGPVGLTLALDLARRDVPVVVLEARDSTTLANPKCNTTNARSMEHYRRLGIADEIRQAGLPPDHPTDVVYISRWTAPEIARLKLPSSSLRRQPSGNLDDGWPTPEPQHRISQLYLEPILARAAADAGADVRFGWRVDEVGSTGDGAWVSATRVDGSERDRIAGTHVVACDGGRSGVRKQIGASLVGEDLTSRTVSVFFRSADIGPAFPHPPAWMHYAVNTAGFFNTVAIDGHELWLLHISVPRGRDFDDVDIPTSMKELYGFVPDHEVLGVEHWSGRRLVADRYRVGNVFLAGDAAHIWIPMGGFGMNAGIGDATALAWMLAAVRAGWGGPGLLDAYQLERAPIGDVVSRAAAEIAGNVALWARPAYEDQTHEVEADTPAGEAKRAAMRELILRYEGTQYNSVGVQLGYRYEGSPLCVPDGTPEPPFAIDRYWPTSRPGSRLPHLWCRDGSALYDNLGPDFTLLRVGPGAPAATALRDAARQRRVPLAVVDVDEDGALEVLERTLVLVRPDQHVAWRGDAEPADPLSVIDTARGA